MTFFAEYNAMTCGKEKESTQQSNWQLAISRAKRVAAAMCDSAASCHEELSVNFLLKRIGNSFS
jgi:hypothetical protein